MNRTVPNSLPNPSPAAVAPKGQAPHKKNPNALLLLFRKYHTYFGLFAGGFIVMIALTGIYLNHKSTFQFLLPQSSKAKADPPSSMAPSGKIGLPNTQQLAALPLTMLGALEQAQTHLGERPIERIELRNEKGQLVYKIKSIDGPEVIIDVHSNEIEIKGEKREPKPKKDKPEKDQPKKDHPEKDQPENEKPQLSFAESSPPALPVDSSHVKVNAKGIDWSKAIKDLHTGKIGGDAGKLLIDAVAVLLILLTISGVYLWIVPTLRKRKAAQRNAMKVAEGS
ncbi:MAG: PepSY domain-containing protein [Gemmataceae bacterium]|jgi:hypothetical protein|nr:PepSY domain-containing protein [Gemmataceae bacterium]